MFCYKLIMRFINWRI